jgi:hypothetical protein
MAQFELAEAVVPAASTNVGCVQKATWVDSWRAELDEGYTTMRKFGSMDITDVLLCLSAFSARAAEMRAQCNRVENRKAAAFRTREVDPFLEEVDRQFRIHSRLQAVRQMEWDAMRGQV